jgi:hypothetical protein
MTQFSKAGSWELSIPLRGRLRDRIEGIASDFFDEMQTSGGKICIFYHHVRKRELREGTTSNPSGPPIGARVVSRIDADMIGNLHII